MNAGDHLKVAFTDTTNGEKVTITDLTTGQAGSMTASAANGFAQIKYAPRLVLHGHPVQLPRDVQPLEREDPGHLGRPAPTTWRWTPRSATSSSAPARSRSRPPSSACCPTAAPPSCPNGDMEGRGVNKQAPDGDDIFCFPGSEALVYKVTGCTFTNTGFDGASYQRLWPDGNTKMHPTPFQFSSPETGPGYNTQYAQAGFEADLPAIEATCDSATGAGCTLIPQTDQGVPGRVLSRSTPPPRRAAAAASGSSGTTSPERSATTARTASTAPCSSSPTPTWGQQFALLRGLPEHHPNPCPQA